MFSGNKKPKIVHSTDGDSNIDASTISFSSANLTLEAVSKFLERKFIQNAAAAQVPTDGKKKGGGEEGWQEERPGRHGQSKGGEGQGWQFGDG